MDGGSQNNADRFFRHRPLKEPDDFSGLTPLSYTQLKGTLNGLYNITCCDVPEHTELLKLGAVGTPGFEKDLAKMVRTLWRDGGMPATINKKVAGAFYKELWKGVTEGYGMDVGGIDYDTPDHNMLLSLQKQVYQFSAAKNYHQLKSLTEALIGEDGKVRSWLDFKKAAYEINDTHINQWLKTEYDTAIASAQMASKWVEIQANKATLKMLEYDAVIDGRTSDLCRGFNGILRPVDDPFWKEYYPPNHFRCRSTVRQQAGGKASNLNNLAIPEGIPEMFKVNLGQRGLIFPPSHPYFIGTPQDVLDSLL